ncbi:MAG: tRNA glutamyl-Q(34) synthetase GluQRS [Rhodospirillaceae bacterium]|nr:tRNA glutamyl-Q(34) synthetase GluQRS [Rhodospirillaceae bacterium]
MNFVTRFAPSPTGLLHLGHAWSALLAWRRARELGGRFILRIEDIDTGRCKPAFEPAMLEDLTWLGLDWDGPVRRQSDHFDDFDAVLNTLRDEGLAYPCFCTRRQIEAEVAASQSAPHGLLGLIYPGTCRSLDETERLERLAAGENHAWRLDAGLAAARAGPLTWQEDGRGVVEVDPLVGGDVVLARKDTPSSYHVAVTHDDHLQGITHIIRGEDLHPSTHVHRLLQALMCWSEPVYTHHGLLRDDQGKRFAKRDRALTLRSLREAGLTPEEVIAMAETLAERDSAVS